MEELNAHEARVLGVLIEKTYTTPDQYPLTLNATTLVFPHKFIGLHDGEDLS